MSRSLEVRFADHLKARFPRIFEKRLLVAVSGGLDSVTLAQLLKAQGIEIALAHVNFQLRGADSAADAAFVEDLAARLAVPFHLKELALGPYRATHNASVQMAARALRYEWFAQVLQDHAYDSLATAHQAEDSLETFVLNLARGTGIEGLSGIASQRENIIRPLLPFSKESLRRYALAKGITWREDRSNRSEAYTRNQIRHRILPAFGKLHPRATQNFLRSIVHLQAIETLALRTIEKNLAHACRREGKHLKIALSALRALDPLETHLHYLLRGYGFSDLGAYKKFVFAPRPGKQFFSKTHRLLIEREQWVVSPRTQEAPQAYVLPELASFDQQAAPLRAKVTTALERDQKTACVDARKISFPLKVRKWQAGDRFEPLGLKASKKVSHYFQDQKFSHLEKEQTWILENGDGKIIWIAGHRLDERFKVEADTPAILSFTLR